MIKLIDLMSEGRYDSDVGKIIKTLWIFIKDAVKKYKNNKSKEQAYEHYYESKNIVFDYIIFVVFNKKYKLFNIDAEVDSDGEAMHVAITINPNPNVVTPKKTYSKMEDCFDEINATLRDVLRHEIEHLTQKRGENRKVNKEFPATEKKRLAAMDKVGEGNVFNYLMLSDEIPAMVQGLYAKAKTDKIPLDDEFHNYLVYFVKQKTLSDSDYKKVMRKWIKYAKKKLPAAQFSGKYIKV